MKRKHLAGAFAVLAIAATASYASADRVGVIAQYPSASPGGRQVVFSADFDGAARLWVAERDGSGLRRISQSNLPNVQESQPAWSPDGQVIAYVVFTESASSIWAVYSDGSHPRQLTIGTGLNAAPAWSPDGSKIAFVSDRSGSRDVWIMNSDGSAPRRLTTLPGTENRPGFSPSGSQIVFSYATGGTASLYVVNTDGTGVRQITSGPFSDFEPSWGVAGIAFSSNRNSALGKWMLWSVQPSGAGMKKIGEATGHDPVWLEDGSLLFTEESANSRALASIGKVNSVDGTTQTVVDVQGFLIPIDIRPAKDRNHVNPRSQGRLGVAILGGAKLDVSKVDPLTITFGRTGAENSLDACDPRLRDLNGDGYPDLACRFATRSAQFKVNSREGVLRFLDREELPYEGRDSIEIVFEDDPADLR